MSKIRVFVSSSLTELESEREIAKETISQLDLEPVMFENLPAMDKDLQNAYLDEIWKSHVFVLILWKDVTDAVEKEYITALECGLPLLLLVKNPTFHEARTARLEKLLAGTPELEPNLGMQYLPFRKKFRTLSELRSELKEGLMKMISDRFTEPAFTTTSVETTTKLILSMIRGARRKLLIVTRTPMILLGPRPYFSKQKNYIDENFHQTMISWIEGIKTDEKKRMIFMYSIEDTYREMTENKLEQVVMENLKKYKSIEEETRGRFQIQSIRDFPGRIIVSDNGFGIQFIAPKDKVISIFRQDAIAANNLMEVLPECRETKGKDLGILLKELRLTRIFK